MQKILECLFCQHNFREEQYPEEWQRILTNKGMLKKGFSKLQKRQLLRIIDDYGLIIENASNDSFAAGVRCGVMFMVEVFHNSSE